MFLHQAGNFKKRNTPVIVYRKAANSDHIVLFTQDSGDPFVFGTVGRPQLIVPRPLEKWGRGPGTKTVRSRIRGHSTRHLRKATLDAAAFQGDKDGGLIVKIDRIGFDQKVSQGLIFCHIDADVGQTRLPFSSMRS
jgi:hypothetical protein